MPGQCSLSRGPHPSAPPRQGGEYAQRIETNSRPVQTRLFTTSTDPPLRKGRKGNAAHAAIRPIVRIHWN